MAKTKNSFGHFIGLPIELRRVDEESWTTLNDLTYRDHADLNWIAPAGSQINGASIPRFFWRVIGSPMRGKYVEASVIHDVFCTTQIRPYKEVHMMFYEACRASGMGYFKASIMWTAVRYFGPKW